MNTKHLWALLLAAGVLCSLPHATHALAITDAAVSLDSLQISGPPGATIQLGSLTTEAFAQANNSLGEARDQFNTSGANSTAAAAVTWANAAGSASATAQTAAGESHINLPGKDNAAAAEGFGDFFSTSFTVQSNDPTVAVTFSLTYSASLHGFADVHGHFRSEVIPSLDIDGGAFTLADDLILAGGPNFADFTQSVTNQVLSGTFSLTPNVPHVLFAAAEAESSALNMPEPGVMSLLAAGLLPLVRFARRGA